MIICKDALHRKVNLKQVLRIGGNIYFYTRLYRILRHSLVFYPMYIRVYMLNIEIKCFLIKQKLHCTFIEAKLINYKKVVLSQIVFIL